MKNKITLSVYFIDNTISVKGNITLLDSVSVFRFSLNKHMREVKVNSSQLLVTEIDLPFRPPCIQYEVLFNADCNEISFSYEGTVSGWLSFIEDNKIAINFYSAWYPIVDNIEFDERTINLYYLDSYDVLNAEFNPVEKTWACGNNPDGPYNIIAFKKNEYLTHKNENAIAYYLNHSEDQAAIAAVDAIKDIVMYLNGNLFPKRELSKYLLVSFSNPNGTGGYIRGNLIVMNHFESDEDSSIGFLAHEIAHEWCTGADFSFEDWLNETTAEWASLLYMREVKCDIHYFNKRIEYHKQIAEISPPIKPADLKRPEKGVHSKGVVLLFSIYMEYGVEAIKELLRLFVGLERKTTEEFISQVKNYNKSIADYLENGIYR